MAQYCTCMTRDRGQPNGVSAPTDPSIIVCQDKWAPISQNIYPKSARLGWPSILLKEFFRTYTHCELLASNSSIDGHRMSRTGGSGFWDHGSGIRSFPSHSDWNLDRGIGSYFTNKYNSRQMRVDFQNSYGSYNCLSRCMRSYKYVQFWFHRTENVIILTWVAPLTMLTSATVTDFYQPRSISCRIWSLYRSTIIWTWQRSMSRNNIITVPRGDPVRNKGFIRWQIVHHFRNRNNAVNRNRYED